MDMNDPATESQINVLRQLHYEPDHALTRVEAAHLIGDLRRRRDHPTATIGAPRISPSVENRPHDLRASVKRTRQEVANATMAELARCEYAFAAAVQTRQEFWMDTCREPTEMHTRSAQVWELYMKHGCRFVQPAREQVQEILDALDSGLPDWDKDHVELFYKTLELNFPGLLRRAAL